MLVTDYRVNNRRSLKKVTACLAHLHAYFGIDRAVDVTTDRIQPSVLQRHRQGAKNATVNRELAAIKRAFALAVKAGRLASAPNISMLEEHNARQGFVDHGQFLVLRNELPSHLKDPITFLYLSAGGSARCRDWNGVT